MGKRHSVSNRMRLIREAQIITLDPQPQQPSKQRCYLETLKEPNTEYRNEKDYYSLNNTQEPIRNYVVLPSYRLNSPR